MTKTAPPACSRRLLLALVSVLTTAAVSAQSYPVPLFSELARHTVVRNPQPSCDVSFAVHPVDVDADGDLDLVLGGEGALVLPPPLPVSLFLNDGQARFTDVTATHLPVLGALAFRIRSGDLDGDSYVDLVLAADSSCFLLNDGSGRFGPAQRFPAFAGYAGRDLALVDIEGDGDLDVVLVADTWPLLRLLLNDGSAGFRDVTSALPAGIDARNLVAADLDGDGAPDLAVGTLTTLELLLNDGSGRFAKAAGRVAPEPPGPMDGVGVADVDGDGDLDLSASSDEPVGVGLRYAHLYLNDGRGVFQDVSATHIPRAAIWQHTYFDVELDGDLDLLVTAGEYGTGSETLLLNDGSGRFADASAQLLPPAMQGSMRANPWDAAVGDFDGDGDHDIVLPYGGSPTHQRLCRTRLYLNRLRQMHAPSPPSLGAPYVLDVYGRGGQWSLLLVGASPAAIALPPFGTLRVDPRGAVLLPTPLQLGAQGATQWTLHCPPTQALLGLVLHSQSLLVEPMHAPASRFTGLVQDLVR